MKKYWLGVFMALAAAVCWGVMSPLSKMIAAAGVSLMTAILYRTIFIVVTLAPFLYFTRGASVFRPGRKLLKFYLLSGFLTIVGSGCGFQMSLEYLNVAEALIVHYTFPLVTLLGSCWIVREKPTKLQILAGFMILVGVYSGMASGAKNLLGLSVPGLLWGALAVVGISGQSLLVRCVALENDIDSIALLFYSHLWLSLLNRNRESGGDSQALK